MIDKRLSYQDLDGLENILRLKAAGNRTAAKANGKYEMPKSYMDSFDWDMWLREYDPNYKTLEEEEKKSKIKVIKRLASFDPEIDLPIMAQEYWQEQFENHPLRHLFKDVNEFRSWSMSNEDQPNFHKGGLASLASPLYKAVKAGDVALQFSPPNIQRLFNK